MQNIALLLTTLAAAVLARVHAVPGFDFTEYLWRGSVAKGTAPKDFDRGATPYDPHRIHGAKQTWAEIITVQGVPLTMFENQARDIQLTLTDDAIYVPDGGVPQTGLRRSELIANSLPENAMQGRTTFHFSVRKVPNLPLNLTHEYQLVFIENATSGFRVFELQYGSKFQNTSDPTLFNATEANMLRLVGNKYSFFDDAPVLFETAFTAGVYHNFAVTIDWERCTLSAYYSSGSHVLQEVVPTRANQAVPGELHIGMVKLPVGVANDVFTEGIQESGPAEAMIFGGLFVEDSSNGMVSLGMPHP